jgi:hypothetical protein
MKKIDPLFFELMQVSVGQLDCLSRGPEPDEWQTLYEISKQQHVVGISYQGVMRLFEFGLRAPQDISLDWMAESETIRETNEVAEKPSVLAFCYDEEILHLRQRTDHEVKAVSQFKIQYVYQQYLKHQMDMGLLLDYYYVLRKTNGKNETLKSEGILDSMGVRRFARGVMWMLQEIMNLDKRHMPFEPLEIEGRFLLSDVMREASKLERVGHVLITYPLGIKDLRA